MKQKIIYHKALMAIVNNPLFNDSEDTILETITIFDIIYEIVYKKNHDIGDMVLEIYTTCMGMTDKNPTFSYQGKIPESRNMIVTVEATVVKQREFDLTVTARFDFEARELASKTKSFNLNDFKSIGYEELTINSNHEKWKVKEQI